MNLFAAIKNRIGDHLLEREITKLYREYIVAMKQGKPVLANALAREIKAACEKRSLRQWARMEAKRIKALDPHARAVLQQESRA